MFSPSSATLTIGVTPFPSLPPSLGLISMTSHVDFFVRFVKYRGADKSLARPTSRCILFDGQNISFDASLVIYINSTNIPPIMIINRIYEQQILLLL